MRTHFFILLLAFCIAACLAEAPAARFQRTRQRQQQQQLRRRPVHRLQRLQVPARTRFFARQEAAPTPYPTAEELKPTTQPELVYGPPEQLYGAPSAQLPAAGSPQEFAPNPDAEEFAPPTMPVPARLSSIQLRPRPVPQVQRLENLNTLETVQPQAQLFQPAANAASVSPATSFTVAQPIIAPAALSLPISAPVPAATPLTLPTQQYFVLNQPFAYAAQFQAW